MGNIYFQLFKKLPDMKTVIKIVELFGIKDLDPNYKFTINDLKKNNILDNLKDINHILDDYYLKCKYDKYVVNLTEKKAITILRHFLKVIDYKVVSREKYSNNKKYLVYNIQNNKIDTNISLTLNFE